MFGVITRDNLSGGIVERRSNGTLVVYRTFRRKPGSLTPFGLYFASNPLRVSDTEYMVITPAQFEELLDESKGGDAHAIRIMARPLLDSHAAMTDTKPLHVHIISPVVLTVPPPPACIRSAESLL